MLKVSNLSVSYGDLKIVSDVSFSLSEGDWLMLAGPNGAGKSTILGAIGGGIPCRGAVTWDGKSLLTMKGKERAALLGTLQQNHFVSYGFTVSQVVRLGRYAFGHNDPEGPRAVEEALSLVGLWEKRHQIVTTLSGGELQRTFLAQLLCQNPKVLLLDEPANHLDLVYQKQVFSLVDEWRRQPGRAVLSVVHDLSLARRYGSRALLLDRGHTVALGPVEESLGEARLNSVYGLDVGAWMRDLYAQWEDRT